jgi:lysozyme
MASTKKLQQKQAKSLASGPVQGCDVSSYQGVIDWSALSKDKDFVIIRATDGAHFVDKHFATNWPAAKANNIPRGAYHFFRPTQDINEQIQNFVSAVGSLDQDDLGVVLDLEAPENWATIEQSQRVGLALQWCDGVEKALGVTPVIYLSPNFVAQVLGTNYAQALKKYPLWIANYNVAQPTIPSPWTTYVFWQYSDTGRVAGITGDVDLDVSNGSSLTDLQTHVKQNRTKVKAQKNKPKDKSKNKDKKPKKKDRKGKKSKKDKSKKNKKSGKKNKKH